jgi:hypothetical protein
MRRYGNQTITWGTPSDVDSTSSSLPETVPLDFENVHVGDLIQSAVPFVIGYLKLTNGTTVSGTGGTIDVRGIELLDVYLKLRAVDVVAAGTNNPDSSTPSRNMELWRDRPEI